MSSLRKRLVIIHRRTELNELLDRHVTRGQVEFFLKSRGRSLDLVQYFHDLDEELRHRLKSSLPPEWVIAEVERNDLSRFLFADDDAIAVVGQDGLVANVAKYLNGQLVVGIDPVPRRHLGVLVRHGLRTGLNLILDPSQATVAELTTVVAQADTGPLGPVN